MAANPSHHMHRNLIDKIQDFIVGPKVIMILEKKDGKILECVIANSMGELIQISELPYIAKLISLRHDIASFGSILGGLKVTLNEFNDVFTFSCLIDKGSRILSVITPKDVNIQGVINLLKDTNSITLSNSRASKGYDPNTFS